MSVSSLSVFSERLERAEKQREARREVNRRAQEAARERERIRKNNRRRELDAIRTPKLFRVVGPKPTEELLARLRAEIPDDTRSLTARLMGDPIPNDRRRQA